MDLKLALWRLRHPFEALAQGRWMRSLSPDGRRQCLNLLAEEREGPDCD
jgi:hypothetical protein